MLKKYCNINESAWKFTVCTRDINKDYNLFCNLKEISWFFSWKEKMYYFPTSSLSFCSPDYFRWKVIERRVFLTTTKNAHWLNLRCGITQIYLIIYPAEFNETEHYSNKIEACLTYIYDVNWMLWMYSYYNVLGTLSIVLLRFRGEGDDLYKRM